MALVVLNLSGFLTTRSHAAPGGERSTGSHPPGGMPLESEWEEGPSHRLDELLSVPGVAAAFAAGPRCGAR